METCSRTDSGKFSRRRRPPISRPAIVAVLALSAADVSAQPPADAPPPADGAAALERFLDGVDSFRAEFEEEVRDADQRLVETSIGTVSLKRPGRFRWNYSTPYELLVLSDGERLWMYDAELAQATVTALDENATSPAMLLSGDGSFDEGFEVRETFVLDGRPWVRLTPRVPDGEFREVSIRFDAGLPDVVEFVNALNETTRITFSDVEVNPALDDRLFEFRRPRGVDVIGDEG